MYAPIAVFAYKRFEEIKHVIDALLLNAEAKFSDFYLFIDGPKDEEDAVITDKIYKYSKTVIGFNKICIQKKDKNIGLAKSIINGVTEVISKYGKVIVVEDDIIVSDKFLSYMNRCMDFYENDKRIWSIGAYLPNVKINGDEVFFSKRTEAWGWATWKDRWEKVDWEVNNFNTFIKDKKAQRKFNEGGKDLTPMLIKQQEGKIGSWSIRFDFAAYENNAYTVHPPKSLVCNIGFDGKGTNCASGDKSYDTLLVNGFVPQLIEFKPTKKRAKIFQNYYSYFVSLRYRIKNTIKRMVSK